MSTGILLINLGTPDSTEVPAVRRYLRQFLSDPRVLDIPALGRWALLNLAILPFRPKQSAEAYRQIWTEEGSPLRIFTSKLTDRVRDALGEGCVVKYAMRYQNPSVASAMEAFDRHAITRLIVVPLYPQYASSSTGSVLEEVYREAGRFWNVPSLTVVPPFYDHPIFRRAQAEIYRENLGDLDRFDHFLISFHGLPERHVTKCDRTGAHCLAHDACCDRIVEANRYCYRAQSYDSARDLAARLGIPEARYTVAFQSRLGRTPWIRPYTDEILEELPKKGIARLAVMIPSFTADCLETLEEIALRGRESFLQAGGKDYAAIPCLNDHPLFAEALIAMIREIVPVVPSEAASG